jgi:hypothetical protein
MTRSDLSRLCALVAGLGASFAAGYALLAAMGVVP